MSKTQEQWERRSTVRSKPRIILNTNEQGVFFPKSHQPLVNHPKIKEQTEQALNYLLVQSFYKYTNDIATIETRVVNNAILSVVTNQLPIGFTREQKINLYTVMVDESYHAYVAYDAMAQVEDYTSIQPLALPETIEIERAIEAVKKLFPVKYHSIFNLIAVCIAENTLTKEILSMIDQKETHPFYQKQLTDHLSDESRHSGIFFHLLIHIWENIANDYKENIAVILPTFIELYLGVQVDKEFYKIILTELTLSETEADIILEETYEEFKLTKDNPKIKNIVYQLEKAGLIDSYIAPGLKQKNWI